MSRRTEKADALDQHIGRYIRIHRENLGMTQSELAQKANVSYQQIHKYEQGTNRISASRLGMLANALQISVQDFYDSYNDAPRSLSNESDMSRLCLETARHFRQIPNARHRDAIHFLVRTLAGEIILS